MVFCIYYLIPIAGNKMGEQGGKLLGAALAVNSSILTMSLRINKIITWNRRQ